MNALTSLSNGGRTPAEAEPVARLNLTAPQKAALIVAALGPEAAGPIIERIGDKHLRAFTRAYAHLQTVPRDELMAVAEEFIVTLTREDGDICGGFDETRELLSQFKTEDEIIRLMDDIEVPGGQSTWEKLDRIADRELAGFLTKQRPQVSAVVLSKLNTEKASSVLNQLEPEVSAKIILCLSKPLNVNSQALSILANTVERDFIAPMRTSGKTRNPGEMIGAMMNNVISEKRDKLLDVINDNAPKIMRDVRKSMLTFQDIPSRVPAKAIPAAIREVEPQVFLNAVKFGRQNAPSSVEFIFKSISQRMAKQYEEQLEELSPPTVKDAEVAQAEFMSIIRRLAQAGEFRLIEVAAADA